MNSTASPFLNLILTRWVDRRSDRDKEALARRENVLTMERALDDALTTSRRKRHADVLELENLCDVAETRWGERLRRLNDWTQGLASVREQFTGIEKTVHDMRWFDRWDLISPAWIARFHRRAIRWANERHGLTADLSAWVHSLDIQLLELEKFNERSDDGEVKRLVSRARKQPYLDHVTEHEHLESNLGERLQTLRRSATHHQGRLMKGRRAIEQAATHQPVLWEIHRHPLEHAWRPVEERWRDLRDEILKEALVFEACRRSVRSLREGVRAMRCVEDYYKAPEPTWKKILGSFSIK